MSVDRVIHSARLVDAGRVTDRAWVAFDQGRVVARGAGDGWRDLVPRAADDAAGRWLTPGFIDIHGHGGGGASFDDGPDAVATARAMHRAHGTTRAVLSLVTAAIGDLADRAAMVAELARADATILGSHLEGPFLDPGHNGAHTAALLREPDQHTIERLLDAGAGTIRQVTLAPELDGGLPAVRRFVAAGVQVAVGHTAADQFTTAAAFDAGATILTHAFNAMNGIHHRAPGPVVAALNDDRVTLEVVADGTHVAPDVIRLLVRSAPGRLALITDAMAAAGGADGSYALGGRQVTVTGGVARLAGGGAIAGSTLTQDAAIALMVRRVGMPLPDAVRAATTVPAAAIGVADRFGALTPGRAADAVLLDEDLAVVRVWVDGEPIA
ncbi:N-acetylglucosamine-6-phosphate deacetylase [Microbacterium kribbense]|uniref:N-acetylglucosamine-6-phosphate deacetylase n=1 Tax=Microbacterium kribbense TaxID=433645 RepID=A0ABP7GM01_9MICO